MAPPEVLELIRCGVAVHQAIHALQQDAAAWLPNCPAHCSVPAFEKQFVGIKTTQNLMMLMVVIMMMIL